MSAIASKIDCKSREFRANQAAMRALIAELESRRATAAEGGPPRARERHLARGKLLPRQRVMTLIDSGRRFWNYRRSRQTTCTRTPFTAPV